MKINFLEIEQEYIAIKNLTKEQALKLLKDLYNDDNFIDRADPELIFGNIGPENITLYFSNWFYRGKGRNSIYTWEYSSKGEEPNDEMLVFENAERFYFRFRESSQLELF